MHGPLRTRGAPALLAVVLTVLSATDDPLESARTRLRASDKWTRAAAVEELAKIASTDAWELVLGALADPKGEVADAAQLALAGLERAEDVARLGREAGLRAKDVLVRARAAEALGRVRGAVPAELLERALADPDAEVRRMGAWAVERRARGGVLAEDARTDLARELERRVRGERDELARGRVLAALCALAPEAGARALEDARRARDPLVRGAAAVLLGGVHAPDAALERLAPLAADEVPSVRRAALEALGVLGSRAAAACLVERLACEGEERMVLRAVELLRGLSGLKHGRDPRPWGDWVRALPAGWTGARARPAAEEARDDPGRTRVALAGLPIVSKRVAILIDLSGSIWNVRPDGRTRKEVVDGKLREALEALPEDTRFNLIPYTGEPHPWKERLVPATRAKVREAAQWFEACRHNGSGNFWDAALLALEDPEVDTLVVLFDGAPTGGTRHRLELIAPLFLERNLGRRVALDVVLVDASRKLQRIWGELARDTGGRLVTVTF